MPPPDPATLIDAKLVLVLWTVQNAILLPITKWLANAMAKATYEKLTDYGDRIGTLEGRAGAHGTQIQLTEAKASGVQSMVGDMGARVVLVERTMIDCQGRLARAEQDLVSAHADLQKIRDEINKRAWVREPT